MKISFSFSLRILQVAVLVFGLTGLALAQSSSAEVNGVVKDTSGAVIPGATVRLIDIATNTETTTTANNEGAFVFGSVRAGLYRIVAEHTGFSRKEINEVRVNVGVPFTVNIELPPGGIQETVSVSASDVTAAINSTNLGLKRVIV